MRLQCKLYFLDGGEEYREVMKAEPWVPQTEWILAQAPNGKKPFTVDEIFRLNLARESFRVRVAEHWNSTASRTRAGRPVDAVLSPVAPTLAPPHDSTRWWGYTAYWNLMDFPAAVFPVGRLKAEAYAAVDATSDLSLPGNPRNPVEAFIQSQWNAHTYDNASVSLQLVGRRLNEEKVLGILQKVEEARTRYV